MITGMQFILTPELGRLVKWLRILGFDAVYFNQINFSSLLIRALRDNRIILTRNSRIINKVRAVKLIQIKSDQVKEQLRQVLQQLNLKLDAESMFNRCTICNIELNQIDKQQVMNRVPEYVFKTQSTFLACSSCQRIYWPGTHWGNVCKILEEIGNGISC